MEAKCLGPRKCTQNSKHGLSPPALTSLVSNANIFRSSSAWYHPEVLLAACCPGQDGEKETQPTPPLTAYRPPCDRVTKAFCRPRQPPALPACETIPVQFKSSLADEFIRKETIRGQGRKVTLMYSNAQERVPLSAKHHCLQTFVKLCLPVVCIHFIFFKKGIVGKWLD